MTTHRSKARARVLPWLLAGALAVGLAGTARAASHEDRSDAAVMAAAKVSLGQAIGIAEHSAGGRAIGAEVDNGNGAARIAVEVASNQGVRTVLIDPQTGNVLATRVTGSGHHDPDGADTD
jgi:hypothetical protein